MTVVLDTHALVWFLQKDKKLGQKALDLILRDDVAKIVPFLVLAEIHYLHAHRRFPLSAPEVVRIIKEIENFEIAPHSEDQIPHLISELDIHDALIVATAAAGQKIKETDVAILSRDHQIGEFSPLPVIWS